KSFSFRKKLSAFASAVTIGLVCFPFLGGSRQSAQTREARERRHPSRVSATADVVYSFQFSPDGRTLAIARGADGPGRVELWDVETGQLLRAIKGFDGAVWSVAFAPNGKSLVTGSVGYHTNKIQEKLARFYRRRFIELKWWDAQTGELKNQLELPGEGRL